MKQRLLSVFAALSLTAGMLAQSWTPPVDPASSGADVIDGGTYFIKNVGCAQYIVGANSWATQISVSTNNAPYFNVIAEAASIVENNEDGEEVTVNGFKLKMNGTFYFSGDHNRNNYEVSNKYLFRDSEASGFVDLGSQSRNVIWVLTKDANGYYRIQSTTENGMFPNAATQYAYAKEPGQPVQFNMTEEEVEDVKYIEWQFIPTSISTEMIQRYGALQGLYEQLNAAVEAGADYNAASAVYNNEESTTEEINAATEALKTAIRVKKLQDLIATYSGEPIDITEFSIVNPNFDANIIGWEVTEGMGQNLGFQAGAAQTDEEGNAWNGYENGDIRISNFIEAWRNGAPLSDGVIAQTVTGLPEGRYLLTANGIATDQVNNNEVVGVYLFYDNGSFVYHTEESLNTENGKPEELSFEFDYDGSASAKIGMMTDNTNANWMCADNFKLYYIGESQTPAIYTALANLYTTVSSEIDNAMYVQASQREALAAALDKAKDIVETSPSKDKSDEYREAYNSLNNVVIDFRNSVTAYNNFAELIDKIDADDQKYANNPSFESYVQDIEALLDIYQPALTEGTFTTEQIEQAIADFEPMLKNSIQKAFDEAIAAGTPLDEPLDITALFDEMEVPYGTTQIAYESDYWKEANGDGNFKRNYGTAEVWNSTSFDVFREIELPKGKYTISVKGFYREADNNTNYANYPDFIAGTTSLYAGSVKSTFTNVVEIAQNETPEGWNSPANIGTDEEPLYVPNNQETAHAVFTNDELAEKCTVSASTVLSEDGKLRFGVKGEGLTGNQWSIWADFHIYFNVAVASDLDDELEALKEEAEEIINDPLLFGGVQEASSKLEAAIATAEEALISTEAAPKNQAIVDLKNAITYSNKGAELAQQIISAIDEYSQKLDELDGNSTYEGLNQLMEELADNGTEEFESNEQIEGWLAALPSEWINHILGWDALDKATIEEPVDLTLLLTNPDFSADNHTEGWVMERAEIEGNYSGNFANYSDQFLEFWNMNAAWSFYQDVPKLREGFYRLTVDGLYRAAGTVAATDSLKYDNVKQNVTIFAGEQTTPLMAWTDLEAGAISGKLEEVQELYPGLSGGTQYSFNSEEAANDTTFFVAPNNRSSLLTFTAAGRYANSIDFEYTGGSTRIGLRQDVFYANDWAPFGNVRLYYLGTTAPDAVKSIDAADAAVLSGKEIYNLAGQKVGKAQKGIYVIGGRKVVVK